MKAHYLRELGLSPLWVLKNGGGDGSGKEGGGTSKGKPRAVAKHPVFKPQTTASQPAAAAPPPAPLSSPPISAPAAAIAIQQMAWEPLAAAVANCEACALAAGRNKTVFGDGNREADVFFVGEGPGYEENMSGLPFVGRAGKLLDTMLATIGRSRESNIYIANIVKCRPPDNRNPEHTEAQQCLPYLQRQIALVRPKLLVALGKVAVTHLLKTEESIATLRQKMHVVNDIPLVVTYHPAYLLRNPIDKRKAWEDLCFIQKILAGEQE